MCDLFGKGFLDSDFNEAVIDKISNFHEIAKISRIHKNCNFKSIIGTYRPTASTLQISWLDM